MRICLISPSHLSTNPRLVKEAQALSEAGHEISIVCGRYLRWGWVQDQVLLDTRWRVTHVPFGPIEAPKPTYVLQTLRRHAATALVRAGIDATPVMETAHGPAVWDLQRAASDVPADLYIAHYVAALPAAARAARRYGAAYAFDAEDFHPGDLPDTPAYRVHNRLVREIESRYLPGAAYLTAASPMIAEAYAETYGISCPKVVLNVFPRTNAPPAPTPRGTAVPGPSLYWFSQTIGAGRGLETAIEAIARAASAPHLYLRGTPAAQYEDTLRKLACQHGVSDRLHLMSPEAPGDMERLGAQYDLGYVGELAETRNRQIALTNKLFSYLLGGVPSVASDIPAHRAIAPELDEAMALFPIGDATALATAIDHLLLVPERLAAARAHAWRLGQERYCWEVECQTLLGSVEEAFDRPVLAGAM